MQISIGGRNGKRLIDFYGSQFGWRIDANNPMKYGVVDTAASGKSKGIGGGVFKTPGDAPPNLVTVYIEVPSITPVLKKIEKSGGKTVMPRTVLPGMVTMAQFTDPGGNLMGLVESKIPPAPKEAAPSKKPRAKKPGKKKAATTTKSTTTRKATKRRQARA
jgi:predicted enzyme related to lactoylglutathione lyase